MNAPAPRSEAWNYCNVLRDDGLSHGDHVEQLTFLLFLAEDLQSALEQFAAIADLKRPS